MRTQLQSLYANYKKLDGYSRLAIEGAVFGTFAGFCQLWFFDLFAHFRLHYCIIFGLIFLWVVYKRVWAIALVLIGLIAINASVLFTYHQHMVRPLAQVSQPSLKIISANILGLPMAPDHIRAYLSAGDIDIAILTEYSVHWDAHFKQWGLPFTHGVKRPQPDNFGIALLSRWPLEDVEITKFGITAEIPTILATAITPLGPIRIIAAHPPPPALPFLGSWRNLILREIAKIIETSPIPVLVGGDLNATPWSYPFNQIIALPDIKGGSFYGTWPSALPQLGIPIDHILLTGPFAFAHYGTGPGLGSDHLPLEAVIVKQ